MPTSHTSTPVNLIPNDIEDAARECIQQFRVCSKLPHLKQDEWVENRLADFNFWCASTGALAPSKASLDYRLEIANETKIRSIILQLLQLLRIVLQNTEVTGKLDAENLVLELIAMNGIPSFSLFRFLQ